MKINKILNICMITALLSSCNDDMGLQPENSPTGQAGQTIRISASMANNGSRLAYSENVNEVGMSWEEGDVLKVISSSTDTLITDFTLVNGMGTAAGEFEGTPAISYNNGDKLSVFYHNNLVTTDKNEEGNLVIKLSEQDGTLNEDYQLMFGQTTYTEGSQLPKVDLKHVVSVLKLTIPTDKTLTQIKFGDNQFRSQATLVIGKSPSNSNYTFQTGDLVYCYDDDTEENSQITLSGTFVPENGVVTVYVYVLPAIRYRTDGSVDYETRKIHPSFTAIDEEGKEYISTKNFGWKIPEQGKVYELSSGIFSIVDFENEDVADGSAENPYEIATADQLYSFMLRCNRRESDKNGTNYNYLNYKLTNDIILDGNVDWEAPNIYIGSFDGCGHKISGSIIKGLFQDVGNGAIIKNLTLDLDITMPANRAYTSYGCLASVVGGCASIINCVNHSSAEITAEYMGGLVGSLESQSSIIGCANTGNLTATSNWIIYMGGLVGTLRDGSTIEACYNTGNLTAAQANGGNNSYFGGLVGYIQENFDIDGNVVDYNGTLRSCWTSASLEIGTGYCTTVGQITGAGTYISCFKVESGAVPSAEQIAEMNTAMTNILYQFDENGKITTPKPSTSLPEIEIEDF